MVSVVPVDSNCGPSGEKLVDACLMARSSDRSTRMRQNIWSPSLSPDLHLKAGEGQYLDHVLEVPSKPLRTVSTVATSTTTPPCAPPPSHLRGALTAAATVTALRNALTSSHKHSTMRRASRQILSRYLQSLRKVHPLLAATQSV
jgi:hypothetical protein